MSEDRRRLFKNLTAMIFVTFLQRGVGFLSIFILSRILTPDQLGMYASVQSTSQTFYGMARLGLEASFLVSVARFAFPEDRHAAEKLLGEAMVLFLLIALVSGLVLFFMAGWIAERIFSTPALEPYIHISAVMVAAHVALQFNFTLFAGFNASATFARITGITAIAGLPPIVGAAFFYGPQGAAWMATAVMAITALALVLRLRREFSARDLRVRLKLPSSASVDLLRIGFPFYLSGLMVAPLEFILIGYMTGVAGVGAMGELRVVQVISSAAMLIPGAISGPLVSHLSMRLKRSNQVEPILDQFRVIWVLSLALAICIAAAWPVIIDIVFGPAFVQARQVGAIAMLVFIAAMLWNVVTCGFLASHSSTLLLLAGVAQALTMALVAKPLISGFGVGGFLAVQAISASTVSFVGLILLGRRFNAPVWRTWMMPLFAISAVFAFLVVGGAQFQPSIFVRLCAGSGLLGFLFLVSRFWVFSGSEYQALLVEVKALAGRFRRRAANS